MTSPIIKNIVKQVVVISALILLCLHAHSQEQYEIQVYASDIIEPHTTAIELHSNASPSGPMNTINYSHPLHETVEITTNINTFTELGFYMFNRMDNGRMNYMGSHIRPRVKVPECWRWKIGASLSAEAGFVKDPITNETQWDYEIRPIFDKKIKKHYIAFNPVMDGLLNGMGTTFSPAIKYAYTVNKKYALGIEYYGQTGKPFNWDKFDNQTHQFYAVADLNLLPEYEINLGIGYGITQSSDRMNIKLILGRSFTHQHKLAAK